MKKQLVYIHGGDSFETHEQYLDALEKWQVSSDWFLFRKKWKTTLVEELGDDLEIFMPDMPNKFNAQYKEWKMWFEKMSPFIRDGVILVGHSLGGIFLAKYLSENTYPKKIGALMLVAPPHSDTPEIGSFKLEKSLKNIEIQCQEIYLYQSEDDPVVPFTEVKRYKEDMPSAKMHIFQDRGHFNMETFPEIVEEIRKIKCCSAD